MSTAFQVKPIAYIESCFPDKFGTPRQPGLVKEALAEICFTPEVQAEESLRGLEGFSHLWVLFWFHQNKEGRFHAKVHPPRLGGQTMGVFATRSPHRPNPIGLSVVEIVEVKEKSVIVRGVDLISGTPVVDIKPYLPEVESINNARQGWTGAVKRPEIEVKWSLEHLNAVQTWEAKSQKNDLKQLIENTIKLDPRPVVYRGYEGEASPYRSEHAVRLYDGDVHFRFVSEDKVEILKILYPGAGL